MVTWPLESPQDRIGPVHVDHHGGHERFGGDLDVLAREGTLPHFSPRPDREVI
jgi:hypothetical protein